MATYNNIEDTLKQVRDQKSFLQTLLHDHLHWPIDPDITDLGEIAFEWSEDELKTHGLSKHLVDGKILQLQPLVGKQVWGIFLLEFKRPDVFVKERGTTRILREVLRGLVGYRGKSSGLKSWGRDQLLFICTHNYQHFRFVYFKQPTNKQGIPPIATFGWGPDIPARTVCEFNLPALKWPDEVANETKWVQSWAGAFNIEKVTKRFYEEYEEVFSFVEEKLKKELKDDEERRKFTQMLFNRLMFLRFIERKGWLTFNGQNDYLKALYAASPIKGKSFYQSRIRPLFFEALATEDKKNADVVGNVPFLNGGLFEEQPLDAKVKDIPDVVFKPILGEGGLFYSYNFTVEESTPLNINVAVDPEMLGKVFEKLVTGRHEKGSYYTPRTIVSFMCKEALKGYLGGYESLIDHHDASKISVPEAKQLLQKLSEIKVVDPACGSGAYLLGMLQEMHTLYQLLDTRAQQATPRDDYDRKLSIIENNLYGVDIDDFATNIARLRLWLSLAVDHKGKTPEPLPNLDLKIETEDSLAGPNPQVDPQGDLFQQQQVIEFAKLKATYGKHPTVAKKKALADEIRKKKAEIAKWKRAHMTVKGFDWGVEFAEVFVPKEPESTIDGEIPLGDKLAAETQPGGFDIVLANPPYGIKCEDPLRFNFFPRNKDKQGKLDEPQSKDSYGLFMARALQLLRPGGHFTYIVSDTWRTIRSHRSLRKRLLEQTRVLHVIDLPSWVFDATVNTCIITAERQQPSDKHTLIAVDLRNLPIDQWATLEANLRNIAGHGVDVQTTEYAKYTYEQKLIGTYDNLSFFIGSPKLYELMSDKRFVKLGTVAEVRAGLQTGDNKYYLRKRPEARGSYEIIDDSKLLTPGEIAELSDGEKLNGVDPKRYGGRHFVPHDKGGESDAEEGWLPNYYVPTQYFIDWSKKAVERLRTATIGEVKRRQDKSKDIQEGDEDKIAAVIRNQLYYFREGITASRVGIYSPTFRFAAIGPFDSGCSNLYFDSIDVDLALSILCASLMRYFFIVSLNHTVNSQGDDLKELPFPVQPDDNSKLVLQRLVLAIVNAQQIDARYPFWKYEQKRIDSTTYIIYGLTEADIREVELWYCRRYPKLAEAQGFLDEVIQKYADHLARCERIMSYPPEYWKSNPILTLIAQGEGPKLEFKETLEADATTGQILPSLIKEALKTVGAFANHTGGKLLIGVSDAGEIKGLDKDYRLLSKRQNKDGFEQKLRSLLTDRLDPSPLGQIGIAFHEMSEGMVCEVTVPKCDQVIHVDRTEVYLRDGNRSVRLEGRRLADWISNRERRV